MWQIRKLSRRYLILLAFVLGACLIAGYDFIFGLRLCGCTPLYNETATAIFQTNGRIMTTIADTATAKALTPTPTLDPRTGAALPPIVATQTASGKIQTETPTP